jgi:hypothetical protein
MFNRIPVLALSIALGPLSFACNTTAQNPPRTGSVEFVADASNDAPQGSAPSGSFVISGLDSSLGTRIATPHDGSSAVHVALPAGVYGVSWNPEADSPAGTWTTAVGLPRVIVVAAGRATTVRIHTVETANPDA